MDRVKPLSTDEWLEFLCNTVKLPAIAIEETEKLAKNLACHSKTIDDFLQLSGQQLEEEYHFDRQGLLNRIEKWKSSVRINVVPEKAYASPATSNNRPDSTSKKNPLISIISFVMAKVDEGQINSALTCVANNSSDVIYDIVKNYGNVVKIIRALCEQSISNTNNCTIQCKVCKKSFQLTADFRVLALLPVCFRCQEQWIQNLSDIRNSKNNHLPTN